MPEVDDEYDDIPLGTPCCPDSDIPVLPYPTEASANLEVRPGDLAHHLDTFARFDLWMTYGMQQGWIGPPLCTDHDGLPPSFKDTEYSDLCSIFLRVYKSTGERLLVESIHENSDWRSFTPTLRTIYADFQVDETQPMPEKRSHTHHHDDHHHHHGHEHGHDHHHRH